MSSPRPSFAHFVLTAALTGATLATHAQCPFDPSVGPVDMILCPNSQGTLMTQVYDSYQWYKDGALIPGAISPTLIVDAFNDSGSSFSVDATLDGCTEMSPPVLVDGWAFLPPTVMTTGGDPLFFTPDITLYCALDTIRLILQQPYTVNIQWSDQHVPIPGGTNDTLVVPPAGGQYSVSGAPAICPDYVQDLGLWISIAYLQPVQPTIAMNGTQLCADPPGENYQWFLDDQPLSPSDMQCIDPAAPGFYTVDVTYSADCSIPSDPYVLVTGLEERTNAGNWRVFPMPATDQVTITWSDGSVFPDWRLLDATGRIVMQGRGGVRSPLSIDVSKLGAGHYWLSAGETAKLAVSVVR
ncbi:MAG: hypothetical protein ABI432_10060 [Flavobacteriales bacterium]